MIRPARQSDFSQILALNQASVQETSELDRTQLIWLAAEASYFYVSEAAPDELAAFLLGFEPHARYESPHLLWFRERFDRFLYVDRIVVGADHRGRGMGRDFYAHLIDWACSRGLERVVCEVNRQPPNPTSLRFHARLGFNEVGTMMHASGKKVSLLSLELKA
jgi:predicted GNAT superfamily acetyltransferase